jgi:DNA-binding XRE family transcriptional regulator
MNKVYFTNVRRERVSANMKLDDVAEYLGIHKETYRLKEIGKIDFTVSQAKKLLVLFNKKFEDVF